MVAIGVRVRADTADFRIPEVTWVVSEVVIQGVAVAQPNSKLGEEENE